MEKGRRYLIIGLFAIVFSILTTAGVTFFLSHPRIAFIRSQKVIEEYAGTLEARTEFEKTKIKLLSNADSLELDLQRAGDRYFMEARGMTSEQRAKQEDILTQRQNQVLQYRKAIEQKIQDEDARIMQEVLNQINSFVEQFAIKEGYDLILGTTLSGSLLYGENSMDVTDLLLAELNNQYKGK